MPRYATIITGDDGREVVSAIGVFEGAAPLVHLGRVEQVGPGVLIGMVRDEAGGFCFPPAGTASAGVLLARLRASTPARAKKPAEAAKAKATKRARKKTRARKPARPAPPSGAGDAGSKAEGPIHG